MLNRQNLQLLRFLPGRKKKLTEKEQNRPKKSNGKLTFDEICQKAAEDPDFLGKAKTKTFSRNTVRAYMVAVAKYEKLCNAMGWKITEPLSGERLQIYSAVIQLDPKAKPSTAQYCTNLKCAFAAQGNLAPDLQTHYNAVLRQADKLRKNVQNLPIELIELTILLRTAVEMDKRDKNGEITYVEFVYACIILFFTISRVDDGKDIFMVKKSNLVENYVLITKGKTKTQQNPSATSQVNIAMTCCCDETNALVKGLEVDVKLCPYCCSTSGASKVLRMDYSTNLAKLRLLLLESRICSNEQETRRFGLHSLRIGGERSAESSKLSLRYIRKLADWKCERSLEHYSGSSGVCAAHGLCLSRWPLAQRIQIKDLDASTLKTFLEEIENSSESEDDVSE